MASPDIVQWLYDRLRALAKLHRALLADHYTSREQARRETRSVAYGLLLDDHESRSWTSAEECMQAAIRWGDSEAECYRFSEDYTGERHA